MQGRSEVRIAQGLTEVARQVLALVELRPVYVIGDVVGLAADLPTTVFVGFGVGVVGPPQGQHVLELVVSYPLRCCHAANDRTQVRHRGLAKCAARGCTPWVPVGRAVVGSMGLTERSMHAA